MSRGKKICTWICAFLILLSVIVTLDVYVSNKGLMVSRYDIQDQRIKDICIVQISDLHNSVFGSGNTRLIKKIAAQNPDIILLPGDIIVSSENSLDIATEFIKNMVAVAPVYCSYGNHEIEYEERTGINIREIYTEAGAVVLDMEYVDIEVKGQLLRIGGIYGYCLPESYNATNEDEVSFLRDFESSESYKILLDHLPYSWSHYGITADYDVDLVLSGHTHGGQVILPFIGGLYEQEFGMFPGKVSGKFESNDTTVIVSRGLGSAEEKLPRVTNIPEIVVLSAS